MERATVYSILLFASLMLPMIWSYSRHRTMERMRRCLRTYLGRTA